MVPFMHLVRLTSNQSTEYKFAKRVFVFLFYFISVSR